MWATTVVPVAAPNRRVRWLWDRPTAAAMPGTVRGRGRFASMWARAAATAGCPAGSDGISVRRHRTVQTSAAARAGAWGWAATARRRASATGARAGPASRMTGTSWAAPEPVSLKWT